MGPCFTTPGGEPDDSKGAVIQRSVCVLARKETEVDSPPAEFEAHMRRPDVQDRIEKFRLFTALVGFVRFAIQNMSWLQPDFAVANRIFEDADDMLFHRFGLAKPEPRRKIKRAQNLTTMACQVAVAQVYLDKRTCMVFEYGKRDANGLPQRFEYKHLWDVVRSLHFTREMMLAAWSHSLEYSIGTSSIGTNIMTAISEAMGIKPMNIFRQPNTLPPEQLIAPATGNDTTTTSSMGTGDVEPSSLFSEKKYMQAGVEKSLGASPESIERYGEQLGNERRLRMDWRENYAAFASSSRQMLASERIAHALGVERGSERAKLYSDALMPNEVAACLFYKSSTLHLWSLGYPTLKDDMYAHVNGLRFCERGRPDGGARQKDLAWLAISTSNNKDGGVSWRNLATQLGAEATCKEFQMHDSGIADGAFMLATDDKRMCTEMPSLPFAAHPNNAFVQPDNNGIVDSSSRYKCARWDDGVQRVDAHQQSPVAPLRVRPDTSANAYHKAPINERIDLLYERNRLPAMCALTSCDVKRCAPLRRAPGQSGLEVNLVALYEHACMYMEAVLIVGQLDGCKNVYEGCNTGKKEPPLHKMQACPDFDKLRKDNVFVPYEDRLNSIQYLAPSFDVMQMAWTVLVGRRFYNDVRELQLPAVNEYIRAEDLSSTDLSIEDAPELSLKYSGYAVNRHSDSGHTVLGAGAQPLLSLRVPSEPRADHEPVPLESGAVNHQGLTDEVLEDVVSFAIGRDATKVDIDKYRKGLLGNAYTWEARGDIYAYSTWRAHLTNSQIGRHNVDNQVDPETGDFKDEAFCMIRDAENMFDMKLRDLYNSKGDASLQQYKLPLPRRSTYRYFCSNHEEALRLGLPTRLDDPFHVKRTAEVATMAKEAGFRKRTRTGCPAGS